MSKLGFYVMVKSSLQFELGMGPENAVSAGVC